MSVTIKDIAKLAKVSHTTVSRALNDSPLIHPRTKEKIKAIADELNYIPNVSARSLVLHRSYNIGLFFSTLNTGTSAGFFYEAVRGVNSVIKDSYNLIVKGIDDYQHYHSVTSRSFDGLIVISQSAADNAFIQHVLNQSIPMVVLNRHIRNAAVTNILSDDHKGAYTLVNYLLEQGHREIALIEGKAGFQSSEERKAGYLEALRNVAITPRQEYQVVGNYDMESGYEGMKALFELAELPTAIFCSNDEMAVGAIKAISDKGLHVPNDISVVGFDDSVFSGFFTPALTTVKRPIEMISHEGATRLLEHMELKESPKETVYMNAELVIRHSVSRRRRER